MFGFLNVYKPKGKTSHDVVAILRRVTKVKQIGHTGTLDPFAEGVLPICIGKSTRLIEYLNDDKAYVATIQFGSATTTYDLEGEITKKSDLKVAIGNIEKELENFKGNIEQLPPIYSAIKVKGKKLYEYARKGEEVKIEPRKVNISELIIKNFDEVNQTLELYIACSKGTYIRSIANDLGEILGCYGHLIKLVRVKAGMFELENATNVEDFDTVKKGSERLIYPLEYLDYPKYELNEQEKEKVSHGMSFKINQSDGIIILTHNQQLCAVATVEKNIIKINKVFL